MKYYSQVFKSVGIVFVIDVPAPCIVPCNECASESVFFFFQKAIYVFFFYRSAYSNTVEKPHMRQATRNAIKYHLDYVNEIGKNSFGKSICKE